MGQQWNPDFLKATHDSGVVRHCYIVNSNHQLSLISIPIGGANANRKAALEVMQFPGELPFG